MNSAWKYLVALTLTLVASSAYGQGTVRADRFTLLAGPCTERSGSGSPEGAVVGVVCDTYHQTDSPYDIYRKTSGTGNTGWVLVTNGTGGAVIGSGTNGYLAQWSATHTLGDGPAAANVPLLNAANVFSVSVTSPIINATTGFRLNGAATSGAVLRCDGTNCVLSSLLLPNAATATQVCLASASNTVVCGDSDLTLTGGDTLNATKFNTTQITDSGLTITRVPFASTGGLLADSANFSFITGTDTLNATKFNTTQITDSGLTITRVPFASTGGLLIDSANFSFITGTDTLNATRFNTTQITNSGLTATRVPFSSTGGLQADDADLTFTGGDTLNSTKVNTTSVTDSGLTATRMVFAGVGGLLSDDSDCTFATDTLSCTKLVGSTSLTAGLVSVTAGNTGTNNYVSQTTGWRCTYAGACDDRYHFSSEFHAENFTVDVTRVLAGQDIVAKSATTVDDVSPTVCPTAGGAAGPIYVKDLPGQLATPVFENSDFVGLYTFSRSGGTATFAYCFGTVSGYADLSAGIQRWSMTRPASGGGSMADGATVPVNSPAIDFGPAGAGFVKTSAVDGAYGVNGPYVDIDTFAATPATLTNRCRYGKLIGITSVTEYGLLCGSFSGNAYVRLSDQNAEIKGIPLSLLDGSTVTLKLDPSVPSFALGATLPSAYGTGTGIWMGKDSGTYKFRVGNPAGSQATWDGTTFSVVGAITSTSGAIGGCTIASGSITCGTSNDVAVLSSSDTTYRIWAGNATAASAPFSVTKTGAATMTTAAVAGAVTVGTGGSIRSGATAYGTGTGYWLDYNSGTPRFRVGTVSGNRMLWNGTSFEFVSDTVTVNSNGVAIDVVALESYPLGTGNPYAYKFTPRAIAGDGLGLYSVDSSIVNQRQLGLVNKTSASTASVSTSLSATNSSSTEASVSASTTSASGTNVSTASMTANRVIAVASDYFSINSSGTAKFYVKGSNGYTEIGGTAPVARLDILGDGASEFGTLAYLRNGAGTDGARLGFESYTSGTFKSWNIGMTEGSATSFTINENGSYSAFGTARLVIAAGGTVTVGGVLASGTQVYGTATTDSSSITTGSGRFDGGVGIAKQLVVGGTSYSTNTPYSYLNGLRVSGGDTGNTIYQGTGDLGVTSQDGNASFTAGTGKEVRLTINGTTKAKVASNGDFYSIDGTVHSLSDIRTKDKIGEFAPGLAAIRGIVDGDLGIWKYKDGQIRVNGKLVEIPHSDHPFVGASAQMIQRYVPQAVESNADGILTITTTPVFWAGMRAIVEVDAKFQTLVNAILSTLNPAQCKAATDAAGFALPCKLN